MRVGLVIYGALETISGGYLYDRQLVRQLRSRGHTVEIVALPWRNYGAHLADNFSQHLYRRLRELRVDLLLQDELNHPSLAWMNRRLDGHVAYPFVSIVHHLRSSEEHPGAARHLYAWVEKAYLTSVHGFVYNSRTTASAVAALAGAVRPGVIAHPAADHRQPPPSSEVATMLAAASRHSGPLQLLFVGNVAPRKRLHTLLAALARLPGESWRLCVVGSLAVDPVYVARIRRQIAALAIGRQVRLVGSAPDDLLRLEFERSHLLAMPSFEGFGIVYLEAMSFGLPVIAANVGAAGEIVADQVNGFLVAPDDPAALAAILRTLQEQRWRLANLGVAARCRYDVHPTWAESMAAVSGWLEGGHGRGLNGGGTLSLDQ